MSGVKLTNLKEFQDMLRRRIAVETKKTSVEIVNKCALQVLIGSGTGKGAVKTTIQATRAQIRKDLNKPYKGVKRIFLLASNLLVKQGYKFENRAQWNVLVAEAALRIFNARDKSRAFLAAGWLQAALDLGPRTRTGIRGSQRKLLHPTGRGSQGRAVPATPGNIKAICYNNSVDGSIRRGRTGNGSAWAIVQNGLNESLANQKRDMELHVVRKETEATLGKFSDKK